MASYYNLPTDNLAGTGSPTLATGTADSAYPLTSAYDLRPDKPFKGSAVGPHRIVWDWGSARTLGIVALFNVLLDTALAVRFQMHTASSWGTPDVDVAVTIPAVRADGRRPNVWADLSAQPAKRYASLYIPANSVAPSVGEIWIGGSLREIRIRPGVDDPESRPAIDHATELGVQTVYDYGVTLRAVRGDLWLIDTAFDTWWQTAKGAVRPSLFVLDSTVNDVMLVRLNSVKTSQRPFPLLRRSTIDATELSPGVPV